jgi:hypothetical protein
MLHIRAQQSFLGCQPAKVVTWQGCRFTRVDCSNMLEIDTVVDVVFSITLGQLFHDNHCDVLHPFVP